MRYAMGEKSEKFNIKLPDSKTQIPIFIFKKSMYILYWEANIPVFFF